MMGARRAERLTPGSASAGGATLPATHLISHRSFGFHSAAPLIALVYG
jgi:hypothetical protein